MEPFFADFDLAQLTLYLFWAFFVGLVIYLQRENNREGFPLENEAGEVTSNQGMPSNPDEIKTFKLPHGRGDAIVPDHARDKRKLALEQNNVANGAPLLPTGDPMTDGIGAAAWADRRDLPELDGHGKPKLQPMKNVKDFEVSAGKDPRGLNVVSADKKVVGVVTDLWVDVPEQLVRYLEVELDNKTSCLLPIPLAKINQNSVIVNSLYGKHFTSIPKNKSKKQVTMLEEEKISAFVGGGNLYASYDRLSSPF
jgi:photosynthetic reaction center H subunit